MIPSCCGPLRDREIEALVDDLIHGPADSVARPDDHDPFRDDRFGNSHDGESHSWDE